MIGEYCRNYRINKGVKLKDLTNGEQIKTLSAFEMGRSSNIAHLKPYIKLSLNNDDYLSFIDGAMKIIGGHDGKGN